MTTKRDDKPQHEICKPLHSRAATREVLTKQVDTGKELLSRSVQNESQLAALSADHRKWDTFNEMMLDQYFTTDHFRKVYDQAPGFAIMTFVDEEPRPLSERLSNVRDSIQYEVERLESIVDVLDMTPEDSVASQNRELDRREGVRPQSVFLVHGHNGQLLAEVEAYLRKLKLGPIILKDEPNRGQTIIEKIETNANVGFVVVLLTGDDEGREMGAGELRRRARQNVVLELGYFMGHLGRKNVCAICEDGVELPSDYGGALYIKSTDWKLKLSQELKSGGIQFSVDDVIS